MPIQLYNLEGQPLEVIPDGSPIPSGRWTTPQGGAMWSSGAGPDESAAPQSSLFGMTSGGGGGGINDDPGDPFLSNPALQWWVNNRPQSQPGSINAQAYQSLRPDLVNNWSGSAALRAAYGNDMSAYLTDDYFRASNGQSQYPNLFNPAATGAVANTSPLNLSPGNYAFQGPLAPGQSAPSGSMTVTNPTPLVPTAYSPAGTNNWLSLATAGNTNTNTPPAATTTGAPVPPVAPNPVGTTNGIDWRNLYGEGAATLAAQLQLAPQMFQAYQQYAPQYSQVDLANLKYQLYGNIDAQKFLAQHPEFQQGYNAAGGSSNPGAAQQWLNSAVYSSSYLDPTDIPTGGGLFGVNQALTKEANRQTVAANTALRQGNVTDAANLGGAALTTLQTLNPNQYQALNRAQSDASNGIAANAYQQRLGALFGQGPSYDAVGGATIGADAIQGGSMSAPGSVSAAGNPLLGFATNQAQNSGYGPLGSDLQTMARDQLALGGSLSPEDVRNAQQAAREAWSARGLVNSNGAIGAEILNRDALSRQRLQERQAFAQNVNQLGQSQTQLNNQYMLGVLGANATQGGQDLQAQQANQAAGLDVGRTNLGALLQTQQANQQNAYNSRLATAQFGQQAAMANQNAGLQAQQQNYGLGTNLAGIDYSRQQQNYGNILSNAQLQSANAFNPFATITSAGSANQGTNPSLFGMGGSVTNGSTGNQNVYNQFNPFNSYAGDLYNTNYNAKAATQIGSNNNAASSQGSMIQGGATVAAAAIAAYF